jgi:hypothetical protein
VPGKEPLPRRGKEPPPPGEEAKPPRLLMRQRCTSPRCASSCATRTSPRRCSPPPVRGEWRGEGRGGRRDQRA